MSTLSFLGCVNIAVNLVQKEYPDAQLYEVQASPNHKHAAASSPDQLTNLRVIFNVVKSGKNGTAIIKSTPHWGEFGPVCYIDEPWLEDVVIPWPLTGRYRDPKKADTLMKEKGYTKNYFNMTLRHALGPETDETRYMFAMVDHTYVLVGIDDGNIETETH